LFIRGRKRKPIPESDGSTDGSLTHADINRRFEIAIANTRHMKVVREDVLGEGEGAWDADPRYPTDTVNCIIWLQLLISEIYGCGMTREEKTKIMDMVRYYGGHVAYGLRKCHYIDLWLRIEPEPFRRINLRHMDGYRRGFVEVDKKKHKTFHNYPCELYHEEEATFDVEYLTAEGLLTCVAGLPPGYYVSFPFASRYYLNLYGRGGGPLGLVHSLVLKVNPREDESEAPGSGCVVYHASTVAGLVNEVPLPEYLQKMGELFQGYTLFELDPNWDFHTPKAEDEAVRRIKRCEAALSQNDDNRKL